MVTRRRSGRRPGSFETSSVPEKWSSRKPVMPGSTGAASQPVAPRLARNSVSAGIREISVKSSGMSFSGSSARLRCFTACIRAEAASSGEPAASPCLIADSPAAGPGEALRGGNQRGAGNSGRARPRWWMPRVNAARRFLRTRQAVQCRSGEREFRERPQVLPMGVPPPTSRCLIRPCPERKSGPPSTRLSRITRFRGRPAAAPFRVRRHRGRVGGEMEALFPKRADDFLGVRRGGEPVSGPGEDRDGDGGADEGRAEKDTSTAIRAVLSTSPSPCPRPRTAF